MANPKPDPTSGRGKRRRLLSAPLATITFPYGTKKVVRAFFEARRRQAMFKRLSPTRAPTVGDIHWAAGFFEADGYVYSRCPTAAIAASQKDRETILRLRDMFGGSVGRNGTTGREGQRQHNLYQWRLGPAGLDRARGVVRLLLLTNRMSPGRRVIQFEGELSKRHGMLS